MPYARGTLILLIVIGHFIKRINKLASMSTDSSDLWSKWNEQDEKRRKQEADEEFRKSLVNVITLDELLLEFRA